MRVSLTENFFKKYLFRPENFAETTSINTGPILRKVNDGTGCLNCVLATILWNEMKKER